MCAERLTGMNNTECPEDARAAQSEGVVGASIARN